MPRLFVKRAKGADKSRSTEIDTTVAMTFINKITTGSPEVREKFIAAFSAIQKTRTIMEAARHLGYSTERPFAKMLDREFFGVCYNLLRNPQMIRLINTLLIDNVLPAINPESAINPLKQPLATLEPRVGTSPNSAISAKIPYRGIKRTLSEVESAVNAPVAKHQKIEAPTATLIKNWGMFHHNEILVNKGNLSSTNSAFKKV